MSLTTKLLGLSMEERVNLYEDAIRLHEIKGFGNRKISKKLNLNQGTVGAWFYRGVYPTGNMKHAFKPNLNPEKYRAGRCP